MRLIDREDLMQTLGITNMDCEKCEWYSRAARRCKRGSDFEDACCAIDDAPTIEPERMNGKWKKGIGENGVTASLFCSRCNYENRLWYEWNYCPNCGAKMEEPEDIPMEYFESGGR